MRDAIMIGITPKGCELIAQGLRTQELTKTRPKLKTPFKCYIYMKAGPANISNGRGTIHHYPHGKIVIGEFICNDIKLFKVDEYGDSFYAWHISKVVIYDNFRKLEDFIRPCRNGVPCKICSMYDESTNKCCNIWNHLYNAPQPWTYVEEW